MKATLDREVHTEIKELIEDTVEHACDEHMLSGELVWTVVQCLATAKIAQLQGFVD